MLNAGISKSPFNVPLIPAMGRSLLIPEQPAALLLLTKGRGPGPGLEKNIQKLTESPSLVDSDAEARRRSPSI